MLQYLINTTAIWLLSLLVYDVFLRRETYHNYNRFYLLGTLLLGGLLPLWQWQGDNTTDFRQGFLTPAKQVIAAKNDLVVAGSGTNAAGQTKWLEAIYIAGALVALCLLIADIIKLAVLYRKGKKTIYENWRVVETGQGHAPFSFLNILFVNSRAQYGHEEWAMIVNHEKMHGTLLHFADLLLVQAAKIIYWFHPLVYAYNKRLLLVHEYQADRPAVAVRQAYGHFLVQQALLGACPSVTHSFNRSPIKNRIIMLTRKSTAASKTKMLILVPLAMVSVICFSKNSFSQKFEKNGNIITYRGNKFEMSVPGPGEDIKYVDPNTKEEVIRTVVNDPAPIKVNGKKIYNTGEVTTSPLPNRQKGAVEDYVLKGLTEQLNKLPDGTYRLDIGNVAVDEDGSVIFYQYGGLGSGIGGHVDTAYRHISTELKKKIEEKTDALLNKAPAMVPATIDGKNVPARTDIYFAMYLITVKGHKSTFAMM